MTGEASNPHPWVETQALPLDLSSASVTPSVHVARQVEVRQFYVGKPIFNEFNMSNPERVADEYCEFVD